MEAPKKGQLWAGWIIAGLVSLMFLFGGVVAVMHPPEMVKNFTEMFGYPADTMMPLGITEIVCALLFLIPRTSILGAILLTGYLGGAVATHVRVHDNFAMAVVFGVLVWLSVYLREPRVRALLPLKS